MTLMAPNLVLSLAMILLLSKHWLRVTRRDRATQRNQRMSAYIDWKVRPVRKARKRGLFGT